MLGVITFHMFPWGVPFTHIRVGNYLAFKEGFEILLTLAKII
jgi:hypothetical protein